MRTIILLLLFPLMMAARAQQSLDKALDALLADRLFDTGDVSLMVYDLTTDTLLYSHRAQKLVRPASVQKVLTSVLALDRLGSEYTFDTELFGKSNDTVCNLFVKGRMDPLFSDTDAMRMANRVGQGMVWSSILFLPIALSAIRFTGAMAGCGTITLTATSLICHR